MEDRVLLVTGSRIGIGRHIAEHYCRRGFKVYGCSRGESDLEIDGYEHHCLDVCDERAVKALFRHVRTESGRLDVLINNAVTTTGPMPTILVPVEVALRVMQVGFGGAFLCSVQAFRLMQRRKFGRIISLGSMAVENPSPALGAIYTASKAAVHSFTRVFAREVFPLGITCNVVAPAAIATSLADQVSEDAMGAILASNAIPTVGSLEDVTNTTDWLIAPESRAITGQVIYLGGV